MRLRNVKNKFAILTTSKYVIDNNKVSKGNWRQEFGNDNLIHAEIGMGKGDFIIGMAQKNPNVNFIGIEKYSSVLAKASQKIENLELENIRLLNIDANNFEEYFCKEIARIYLNFSDPWPKNAHAKRRLTSSKLLSCYDKAFINNADIWMKTDNQALFEYSLESLSKYGYELSNISLNLHASNIKDNVITEYEERFVKENKPIFRLEAIKYIQKLKNLI